MAAPTTQHQQQQVPDAPQCQFRPISNTEPHYSFSSTSSSEPSPATLSGNSVPVPQHYSQDQRQHQQQFLPYQTPKFYNNQHAWTAKAYSHQIQQQSQYQHQSIANCQASTSPVVNQSHYSPYQYQVYRYATPRTFPVVQAQYNPSHISHPHQDPSFSPSELHQRYLQQQRSHSAFPAHAYPTPPSSMSISKTSLGAAAPVRKATSTRGTKRSSRDADLEDADCGTIEPDSSEEEPEDDDGDEYNPQSPTFSSRSSTKGTPKATPTSEVADKESGKPYAVLVYEALMSTESCSMTVSEIYDYFKTHHPHFRNVKGRGWMNSIRYNLSMNEGFNLIQRPEGQEGKGGIWMVTPEAQKNGIKSTTRSRQSSSPRKKRYQSTAYSLRVSRQPLVPVTIASQHYAMPNFEDDSDVDYEYDEDYPESHRSYLGSNGPMTPQSPYLSYQDNTSFYPCIPPHDLEHALARYNSVDSELVSLKTEDGSPIPIYMPKYSDGYPSPPSQDFGSEGCGFGSSDQQQFMLPYDQSLFDEQFGITQFMDSYGNVTPLNTSFV